MISDIDSDCGVGTVLFGRVRAKRDISPAARAWITLGLGILVWQFFAPPDQLLSEQADRWLAEHPVLTTSIVMCVALHLVNAIPVRLDPMTIGFDLLRHARLRNVDILLRISGKSQKTPLVEI